MNLNRGYITFLLLVLIVFGLILAGGFVGLSPEDTSILPSPTPIKLFAPNSSSQNTLQMESLGKEIAPGLVLSSTTFQTPKTPPINSKPVTSNTRAGFCPEQTQVQKEGKCIGDGVVADCSQCCTGVPCGYNPGDCSVGTEPHHWRCL